MEPAPRQESNSNLVVQSNNLISARRNFTLAQTRLFVQMVSGLEKDQDEFHTQRIWLRDFIEDVGTSHKGAYNRARMVTKSLMGKVVELWDEEGNLTQCTILHKAYYPKGKPYVEITFHPDVRPHLLQLKERFTRYHIQNVLRLGSAHAVRIYELLKQYETAGERTIEVDRLKKTLGVENKYARYNDFKRNVLEKPRKELAEKCDIAFTFEEIKHGRRVHAIRFIISRNLEAVPVSLGSDVELIEAFRALGVKEKIVRPLIKKHEAAFLWAWIKHVNGLEAGGQIKTSIGGYLLTGIKSGNYPTPPKFEAKQSAWEQGEADVRQQAQEEHLIAELLDAYETERKNKVNALVETEQANPTEKTQQALEAFWEEHPYMRDYGDASLRSVLARDLPEENFSDWALKRHGYVLVESGTGMDGKPRYRYEGKQGDMFAGT